MSPKDRGSLDAAALLVALSAASIGGWGAYEAHLRFRGQRFRGQTGG
jgi:hypothetical protein